MLKIGLTGGIGSGKSTVTKIFSNLGITIIDADIIAHQLTQSESDSFKEIKQLFGDDFITHDGELDRKKIAQKVFSKPSTKTALERILHPKIKQQILQEIKESHSSHYIILAIPLLMESDFTDLVDRTLVIDSNDDIRIKRIQQRDTRSEKQIRDIMANQIDRKHRLQRADDILNNNGNLDDLNSAVSHLHKQYMAMAT